MIFNKLKSSSVIVKKIFIFGILAVVCLALIFFVRYNFTEKVIESKGFDLGKMLGLEKLQEASENTSKEVEERSKAIEESFKKMQEEYLQSTSSASSSETITATSTN